MFVGWFFGSFVKTFVCLLTSGYQLVGGPVVGAAGRVGD